ncbi:hypothetical protein LX32DRAFT_633807 [Colletotrichum zoysiae]|uniref:Uncharacterized protein n=1 Tax=Colletotrichum zoysiae TaxID=1216348 RepID=A0AAD9M6B4_9PEZI|nr:hypothetical protein LX32DRAFT_633807 [Colletotrichum zoysiae]
MPRVNSSAPIIWMLSGFPIAISGLEVTHFNRRRPGSTPTRLTITDLLTQGVTKQFTISPFTSPEIQANLATTCICDTATAHSNFSSRALAIATGTKQCSYPGVPVT